MKTRITLIFIVLIFSSGVLFSQETKFKHFPAQLSFVYPLGIHELRSIDYIYNFSLNALVGSTGGIKGCEIGGLLNMNKSDMLGFQAGGIGNITRGNVNGMQAGGIFSMADSLRGIQVSGIMSKSSEVNGIQVSGIVSLSQSANVAISGIANLNNGNLKGIQIGGIYNQTEEHNGIQIGLINVSDTINRGISIGLINIVRKGFYQEFSVSVADYLNFGISYKAGVKHFYNIYSVGMNFLEDQLWAAGLGFGHISDFNARNSFQPEIICYTYFPRDFRHIRDTYITHIKFGFVHKISEHLAISFAPSVYGSIKSDRGIYSTSGYVPSPIRPIVEYDKKYRNSKLEIGFGLSLGLNFR